MKACASFTKKVDWRLAKRPLKTSGRLAKCQLTSLVKEATVVSICMIWCNAFCPGLFVTNVITLDLSALIRSNPKYILKWGQRNFSKNVNNKRPFSTCFRLLNTYSPKGILNPLSWLWLAGLYVIEALFHMLPSDAHYPADLLYPGRVWHGGCSMAGYTVHTDRRPRSYCRLACWTLNPASGQSYCSFNSHKNSNFALMKYTLRASAGMNTFNEVIP